MGMNKRTGAPRHLAKVLAADDAQDLVRRMTGKTVQQWSEKWSVNLLKDVQSGMLNPDAWYLPSKQVWVTRQYGFADDDLVFAMIPVKLLKHYNRDVKVPHDKMNGPDTKMLAFRLNPEKFAALSNLYRAKAA